VLLPSQQRYINCARRHVIVRPGIRNSQGVNSRTRRRSWLDGPADSALVECRHLLRRLWVAVALFFRDVPLALFRWSAPRGSL